MYLSKLHIKNYRVFSDINFNFNDGINVLIGENNSGKTALIDVLRICLNLYWERRDLYVSIDDFHIHRVNGKTTEIEFDLTFKDLSPEEQGVFIEMLAINENEELELQLHLRYQLDIESDKIKRSYWGGENEGQDIPSEVLELFYSVSLGALRDATRELNPNRGNRLSRLFLKLVTNEQNRESLANEINEAVKDIESWNDLLKKAKEKIEEHLVKSTIKDSTTGVDINFVDSEYKRIVEGLKTRIPFEKNSDSGESFEIWQNGLGYNNLVYAAAVFGDLLERKLKEPYTYSGLLIEEPEAHLHPQLQNTFFDYLNEISQKGIQVFVTSHSPTVTAQTNIDSLVILTQNENIIKSTPIQSVELSEDNKKYLKKFLDVTKSQLFFAKKVMLVEGISEAILLPCFFRLLDIDYKSLGIEIINIGGVSFEHFAKLLNNDDPNKRINIRCAILTDDDRNLNNNSPTTRAENAKNLESGLVKVFWSYITFEYELFKCNKDIISKTYNNLHPKTNLEESETVDENAMNFLEKLNSNNDKADFALLLSEQLNDDEILTSFKLPMYIENALLWISESD